MYPQINENFPHEKYRLYIRKPYYPIYSSYIFCDHTHTQFFYPPLAPFFGFCPDNNRSLLQAFAQLLRDLLCLFRSFLTSPWSSGMCLYSAYSHLPKFVYLIPLHTSMLLSMAISAQQLEVIPCQRYQWIANIFRRQRPLVVDDFSGLVQAPFQAVLAQPAHACCVSVPRVLPSLGLIEFFRELFHNPPYSKSAPDFSRTLSIQFHCTYYTT